MASWTDYLSLTLTISLIASAVYGVIYLREQLQKGIRASKDKLHDRGIDISAQGASVKTHSKLADRENYFDATQRGVMKALSKSSVGREDGPETRSSRHGSFSSLYSRKTASANSSPRM
ncbi:uncharacterized protein PHACADRAFT_253434 [Phanerochaete carnosa HHB-10118-sp]|uniref:Uncharacterized protein n=1 Tax=Phanerochaete carnosa (strain HHB-10118-sp) TaxID=650164 RepID=K5VXS5_PHACS|nr:uncharacterized protein PHACADRAFT_253434 [Phanerochaete carnosa HHB-10118-sp]EKM56363.1 hypothetical protein PHACADRAFT_253434 [Phanerochaete carnosa HHB-10118-sp]